MSEIKSSDFDWNDLETQVKMIRAMISDEDYNKLKSLSAIAGQPIQEFLGNILKSYIRKNS
jgi:hypothetical protein